MFLTTHSLQAPYTLPPCSTSQLVSPHTEYNFLSGHWTYLLPLVGLNVSDVVSTFHCIKHVTCNEGGLTSQPGQGRTQAVNVLAEPALVAGSWSPEPEWSGPACNTNLQSNLCRIQSLNRRTRHRHQYHRL